MRIRICALVLLALVAPRARAEVVDRVAAVVNGSPIPLSDVEDRVQVEMARVLKQPAGPSRDKARQDLLKAGLEQLLDEKLVEAEASALGLEVAEEELQRSEETLAKQNGMELAQFKEAVAQQGFDFEQVRDTLRRQALRYKLLQFKVKPRKVSDEELQAAYAAQNKTDDFEVRARHLFVRIPENASAQELATAGAKAEEAVRRLKKGEEFAVVARDLSEGPGAREGGDLGYFRRGMMLKEIEQAAFSLQPGQSSPLIRTPGGYHLVKVEDRRKLPPRPFAEVQEQLRNQLASESIVKEQDRYLQSLRKSAVIDIRL